ncbi:MAG: prepilin-type N-terminal cleavage/methylation domain-containing protein [Planctomycetota bacterium]
MPERTTHRDLGFTLIELLVVVAVVALLIGLLLPALSRARAGAWKAQDLGNYRQFGIAQAAYEADHDIVPLFAVQRTREGESLSTIDPSSVITTYNWMVGWGIGGKSTIPFDDTQDPSNTLYSHEAERPLNPYIYDDIAFEDWAGGERTPADERTERAFFQSPVDGPNSPYVQQLRQHETLIPRGISKVTPAFADMDSLYDFVGTSYMQNTWLLFSYGYDFYSPEFDTLRRNGLVVKNTMEQLVSRIVADMRTMNPSRTVFMHDPTLELTQEAALAGGIRNDRTLLRGQYGETGRHLMLMFDGSAGENQLAPEDVLLPAQYREFVHMAMPPVTSDFAFGSTRRFDEEYNLVRDLYLPR